MSAFSPSTFPPNELWDFSVRIYAQPGVEGACLALQEDYDMDVNILLYCCWVAAGGRGRLEPGELGSALSAVVTWRQNAIIPLRRLRGFLKGDIAPAPRHLADDLRRVTVESELHAEHIEQIMLTDTISRTAEGPFDQDGQAQAAAENLKEYLKALDVQVSEDGHTHLAQLLTAAFPNAEPADAVAALKTA